MVIKQMKPLGLSLEEVAEILELLSHESPADAGNAQAMFTAVLEKALNQRAKLARNLTQTDESIGRLNALPSHGCW